MKIWLTANKNVPFESSSFRIISPFNGESPLELDKFMDNNECTEIVVEDILAHIPYVNIKLYVQKVVSKLAHKGQITIFGTDCLQICKDYYNGNINIEEFNSLLMGTKDNAWAFKQSCITLFEVSEFLKENGLKLIQKRLPQFQFSVTAQRD